MSTPADEKGPLRHPYPVSVGLLRHLEMLAYLVPPVARRKDEFERSWTLEVPMSRQDSTNLI